MPNRVAGETNLINAQKALRDRRRNELGQKVAALREIKAGLRNVGKAYDALTQSRKELVLRRDAHIKARNHLAADSLSAQIRRINDQINLHREIQKLLIETAKTHNISII